MNNYSFFQKLFHKLIVNNNYFLNISYDLEKILSKKHLQNTDTKKLFITGYARSGTTILLNNLYNTGMFKSLTYEDMPFIMSPKINNLFKKFRVYKPDILRAHKDEIKINLLSPEAFEEVFWKNRLNGVYIKKNFLEVNDFSDDLIEEFLNYINLINSQNKIYLSKNNNNILRIEKIKNISNSLILILFRCPKFQSKSLQNQHLNFSEKQKKDKFVLDYMNSIGHYEFGKNHKVFFNNNIHNNDLGDVNYWLYQWIKVYKYLLDIKKKNKDLNNVSFLSYEKLSKNTDSFNRELSNFLKMNIHINKIENKNEQNKIKNLSFNKHLLDEANIIYDEMENNSFF